MTKPPQNLVGGGEVSHSIESDKSMIHLYTTLAQSTGPQNLEDKTSPVAELYALTGGSGLISVSHKKPGGTFTSEVIPISEAAAVVDSLPGADVWISAATLHPVKNGRGGAADIKRLLTLPLDIDIKTTGIKGGPEAEELIEILGKVLGTPPAAIVRTGGGVQPWWTLDASDPQWESTGPSDPHLLELTELLKRWGRLCRLIATKNNLGNLDSVFDLARILRAPGSFNHKYPEGPREVKTEFTYDTKALTYAQVLMLLDAAKIPKHDSDRELLGAVHTVTQNWPTALSTCRYTQKMIEGWATDIPGKTGRHPWLLGNATRLNAALRNGCITHADYASGVEVMGTRFTQICTMKNAAGEPPRAVLPDEIPEAFRWGNRKVECMTPEKVAEELGNHTHNELAPVEFVGEPIDPAGEWAPLRKEKTGPSNPPPIPIEGLPPVMRNMIEATAAAAGAPRDVVLAGALGIAAAATRGVFTGNVDGAAWDIKTTALWTLALSPSGTAKGDGFGPLKKPLELAETEIVAQVKKENRARTVKRNTATTELAAATKLEDEKSMARHLDALEKVQPLEVPQYIKDDVTAEALGQQMQKNGGPIALISTEGEQFITASGGYQNGTARLGLFNRAKDGERFSDGRVGREGTTVARPVLTWVMAIQPEVMRGYSSASTEGSGFLNRFLPFLPQKIGKRTYPLPGIPVEVSRAWGEAITLLHNVSWALHQDITKDPDRPGEPVNLRFTAEAGQLLIDLKNQIEEELQNDLGRYMGLESWIAKHPTDIARIAVVLALLENPDVTTVEGSHVGAALSMFDGFVNHARTFFDVLRAVDADESEHKTLAAIIKLGQPTFTTRELHTKLRGQAWVTSVEDVRQVLADLTLGHTATDCGPVRGPTQQINGGRPSESWQVHPELLTGSK
jgi:hypothetical protein